MLNKYIAFLIIGSYAVMETAYFGWNNFPQTNAEVLADGIVALGVILAVRG
jgi:hypothetical protein